MKVIKPIFIHHDKNPIFSCDIHPDGLRFATGGQSKYSGRVAIWNLRAVTDEAVERDENVPKLLCHLDNHQSCVNSVRWSHSGQSLASGGDDKLIMIWTRTGEARVNAAGVLVALELWRCLHTLTAHESDVLDVAWAPLDGRLASCSVDNTVIVWSMDGRPSVVARLTGHAGLVKGVAWDPVGEFLVSQSDDRTLRVWRTSDWAQQVAVTEPFKDCGDMTHVLRLHWSPDGQYVVSAHASNCGGPTAQIIERPMDAEKLSWACDMDFVGHRKAVTCVKFNGNLLKNPNAESKFCVVATGSRDCSIALWSTQQRRPLFVIDNIFAKSVLDISWAADGLLLMACSWDGSVAFFHFTEGELGLIVSAEEKMAALEGLYGKSLLHGKVEPVLEAPELLPKEEVPVPVPQVQPLQQSAPQQPRASLARQIEVRGADGKRRVTPITVPRDAPMPNLQSFSSSSSMKTTIVVEQRAEVERPCEVNRTSDAPKKKRMALAPSDEPMNIPMVRALPAAEQRGRQELRPQGGSAGGPLLRAMAMDAGGTAPVIGATGSHIVVENMKDPVLTRVRRESHGLPGATSGPVQWELMLSHTAVAARCTTTMAVLACADRSVHVLNAATGMPRMLPLLLPGPPACLDLNARDQLCVVTTCGHVLAWDLSRPGQTLKDSSLRSELYGDGSLQAMCKLKDDGFPVIVLTNGRSFSYSGSMGWQLLTDVKTALWQLSSQKDVLTLLPAPLADAAMPLRTVLRELRGVVPGRVAAVRAATASQCTAALLQNQLLAAAALGSDAEVRVLLLTLVRLLAQDGALGALRSLLLTHAVPRALLPECLALLKDSLPCQRLFMELSRPQDACEADSLGPPALDN